MTTNQELRGKWQSVIGSVKNRFGQITDDELMQVEGDLEQLSGLIQQKTGQSREAVESFLSDCCDSGSALDQVGAIAAGAGESIREGYDQAAEQTRQGYEATVKTLSRHPLESVGVAVCLGVGIGLLFGISIGAQRERELSWRERLRR